MFTLICTFVVWGGALVDNLTEQQRYAATLLTYTAVGVATQSASRPDRPMVQLESSRIDRPPGSTYTPSVSVCGV